LIEKDWLYYSTADGIYKIRLDGSKNTKLCDDAAVAINLTCRWIFHAKKADNSPYTYKMKRHGSHRSLLFDTPSPVDTFKENEITHPQTPGNINNLSLVTQQGEWVFFDGTDRNLYRMKEDGTIISG